MTQLSSSPENQNLIFRTYVEQADDGIFIASPDGVYLHVNSAGHRMLGYADGELLGKTIANIVQVEAIPAIEPALNNFGATEVVLDEWKLVRKDKSIITTEVMAQRLDNGFLLATVRDRSERIKQESQHKEALSRLEKLASQLPGVVYQFKMQPDGKFCMPYSSDKVRELFRIDQASLAEDASEILNLIHPDDWDVFLATILHSAEEMQLWSYEFRLKFPDGEVRWLRGNSSPEKEADGSVLWHGFITDITSQKNFDAEQNQLSIQLQQSQKVESIGRLAGGVAHDFNNLLTSILGFSELALNELESDSVAASHMTRVIETATRGAALTQQLLAFARKKIIKPESVNLSSVVNQLTHMIERLLGEDIELQFNLSDELGTALVDVGSFEQVIINLVINARDAMPMGGKLSIDTTDCYIDENFTPDSGELVPGSYVLLSVSDNGNGIHPDIADRIFEPFYTTKAPGHGTGLGLATCYGIIKQAGGHIMVESELGEGSSFRVYLPKVGLKAKPLVSPTTQPQTRKEGIETILIVEDEQAILNVAKEVLSNLGYTVLTECNGIKALELADEYQGRIDLLFTDVVMPKMGGKELASRLALRRYDMKVLYTSGYTGDAIVNRGVLEQGVEFLQKPYTLQALSNKIREILD